MLKSTRFFNLFSIENFLSCLEFEINTKVVINKDIRGEKLFTFLNIGPSPHFRFELTFHLSQNQIFLFTTSFPYPNQAMDYLKKFISENFLFTINNIVLCRKVLVRCQVSNTVHTCTNYLGRRDISSSTKCGYIYEKLNEQGNAQTLVYLTINNHHKYFITITPRLLNIENSIKYQFLKR